MLYDEKYHPKPCGKRKKVIDRGERTKKRNEVKPVVNISKKPQSFLGISPV